LTIAGVWRGLIAAWCVVLALALTPSAHAAAVNLPFGGQFRAIVAWGAHVVSVEPAASGAPELAIHHLDATTQTDQVILKVPTTGTPDVRLVANATGYLLAVRDTRLRIIQGGYDGSQRTIVDCLPTGALSPSLFAGDSRFLIGSLRCGAQETLSVDADGTLTPVPLGRGEAVLTYREPYVALLFGAETVVRNLATGRERRRGVANFPDNGAFTADGTLVTATESEGLVAWRPDGTTAMLARHAFSSLAAAGGRVVFSYFDPFITELGRGTVHRLTTPAGGSASLLGFDGTTAAFETKSCRGDHQQVTFINVTESPAPGSLDGCPLQIAASALRFSRSGRASVHVGCPNGCQAQLQLIAPLGECGYNGQKPCRVVATAPLDFLPSSRHHRITFRLTPFGRRIHRHRLKVDTWASGGRALRYRQISRVLL
jgi:hypothetical protein